ncbi:hypothetical protein [Nannocystis punicea]|uniref:Uncharacterized protein n=1 Tax=Nannocystis punicea TaxID=2995304 RepID=A0ABY7HAI5_9BACT|nr:hypothetical protein [Nannocystis poenicansa]WAS96282.1 hypothetical protein O0S08_08975 [Nannocystis poenicansa]
MSALALAQVQAQAQACVQTVIVIGLAGSVVLGGSIRRRRARIVAHASAPAATLPPGAHLGTVRASGFQQP